MAQALTIVTLAASLARLTGAAFVVVEVENASGGDLSIPFASLGEREVDMLEGQPLVLRHEGASEAQDAFNLLTAEAEAACARDDGPIEAVVTYVGPIGGAMMTTSNVAGPCRFSNRHVFRDGRLESVDGDRKAA